MRLLPRTVVKEKNNDTTSRCLRAICPMGDVVRRARNHGPFGATARRRSALFRLPHTHLLSMDGGNEVIGADIFFPLPLAPLPVLSLLAPPPNPWKQEGRSVSAARAARHSHILVCFTPIITAPPLALRAPLAAVQVWAELGSPRLNAHGPAVSCIAMHVQSHATTMSSQMSAACCMRLQVPTCRIPWREVLHKPQPFTMGEPRSSGSNYRHRDFDEGCLGPVCSAAL